MKENIVGFDARENWLSFHREWSRERQETFLLKHDVIKPLSVDTTVWRSVFSNDDVCTQPPNIGWRHNTWARLSQLEEFLHTDSPTTGGEYWIIAITQFLDHEIREAIGIDHLPVQPEAISNEWELLGYDVAEMVFLSGLANMGYSSAKRDQQEFAQHTYGAALNDYHLFVDKEVALKFALWSNDRDTGHPNFYVYGLYLVQRINAK